MHDRFLAHLVTRTHDLNLRQIEYLDSLDLHFADYRPTRLDADKLFRDGLGEKVREEKYLKKVGYFAVKWLYYFAVYARSVVFP